jgi:toxin ParE1/3/4
MLFRVVFTPRSRKHLQDLYDHIADCASPVTADKYIDRVIDYCLGLDIFPRRGRPRDDIRQSMRTLAFERRVTVAFVIENDVVAIHGVYYGGQDFEEDLRGNV